jgi:uncharacterized glyoxalase superfamily protein PhnB
MSSCIINIDVPDLQAGIAFYTVGLGFRMGRLLFGGSVVELLSDSGAVFLIEKSWGSVAVTHSSIKRDYNPHWTPVHLDLAVANLDASLIMAINAGATTNGPVTDQVFGRLAPLRDPFGHGFCLIEFSSKGYDAATD